MQETAYIPGKIYRSPENLLALEKASVGKIQKGDARTWQKYPMQHLMYNSKLELDDSRIGAAL